MHNNCIKPEYHHPIPRPFSVKTYTICFKSKYNSAVYSKNKRQKSHFLLLFSSLKRLTKRGNNVRQTRTAPKLKVFECISHCHINFKWIFVQMIYTSLYYIYYSILCKNKNPLCVFFKKICNSDLKTYIPVCVSIYIYIYIYIYVCVCVCVCECVFVFVCECVLL